MLSVWTRLKLCHLVKGLPFPNQALVFCVCSKSLLKMLLEKEKMLVMSNFSFSHSVFYPFGELCAIFIKFKIVICKLYQFGSLKFVVWERVKNQSCYLLLTEELLQFQGTV